MGIVTVIDRWSSGELIRGHFIYLGYAEDSGGRIFIKVGRSSDPYKRFLAIAHGSPLELRLFRCVRVPTYPDAKIGERLLHKALARFRAHGEWFVFDAKNPEEKAALQMACKFVFDRVAPGWHWDSVDMKQLKAVAAQSARASFHLNRKRAA